MTQAINPESWCDEDLDSSGSSAGTRLNMWEMVGAVSGGTLIANASVAPAYATVFGGTALGTSYVGLCKRHGVSLDPRKWDHKGVQTTVTDAIKANVDGLETPPVAPSEPGTVTNKSGKTINPEDL